MKQMKFFAMAVAALTMFSCSKENTDAPEGQTVGKTMQITIAKAPTGKAGGAPAANNATTISGDSYVLGFDGVDYASKLVYKKLVMIEAGLAATVTGVPTNTAHFAIVSNLSATDGAKIVQGMTYKAYNELLFSIAEYQTIATAPMTNSGAQTLNKDNPAVWTLTVSIAPIVSRIEVASISANDDPVVDTDEVTAFDLVGVYVNGYFTQFTMAGTQGGTQTPLVIAGADLRHADDGGAIGSTVPKWSYDYYATALSARTSYSAADVIGGAAGDVWNYMISPAGMGAMPRIVFEINNVSVNGVALGAATSFFVTVKSFKDNRDVPITSIDRNTIFKISDVHFDGTNLGVEPNQETVSVEATVTVLDWIPVIASPEL